MDNLNSRLVSLLDQLPSLLDGDLSLSWDKYTYQKVSYDVLPSFHDHQKIPSLSYLWDRAEQVIKEFLIWCGYHVEKDILTLPKIQGSFLVIDIKKLFTYNADHQVSFGDFVSKIQKEFNWFFHPLFEKTLSVGIFINVYFSFWALLEESKNIIDNKDIYGMLSHTRWSWYRLLMEFSSPNMAKSMTIGHFRNTIIGQIIYNILLQTGCFHMSRNYIGDRWTAFGKFVTVLIVAYQKNPSIIDDIVSKPQHHIGELYATFKDLQADDKEDKARKIVVLMEQKNPLIQELRSIIRQLSLIDFESVYSLLNIHFDCTLGESFAVTLDNHVLDDLRSHDIIHESQWALIIKLQRVSDWYWRPLRSDELDQRTEWVDQVMVFMKSDWSTLYAPRDLALLKYRTQILQADRLVYVVWSEQSVYFEHLISLGEYLWWIKKGSMIHLSYWLYLQNGKKMSSRSGGALWAYQLIDDIAEVILQQSEGRIDKQIAQKLAVSALIINDTKGDITKDVNLDIPSMTKVTGDTGVYIQYTIVRMKSLLTKLNETLSISTQYSFFSEDSSLYADLNLDQLLFLISLLPLKIFQSIEYMRPHVLTQYLLELAGVFNKRYNDTPKLLEKTEEERQLIVHVLSAYSIVYTKTMNLLHLPEVERM